MKHSLLAVGVLTLAAGTPAWAQTNVERFERQLQQIQQDTRLRVNPDVPAEQRAMFDYGGFLGLNFLSADDLDGKNHILRQYDLVGYARLNLDNTHEFFLRARTSYRDFNDGDSFDGEGDETIWPTIEQAYYRFDLAHYLAGAKGISTNNDLVLQAGRQYIYWANGLVMADTIDGGFVDITLDKIDLLLLGGITSHDTIDFDSSRPQFDDRTERGFYGGMLTATLGKHRPFIYGLVQRDNNEDVTLVTGPISTQFEYDSYYIGAGSNGSFGDRWVYGLEVVYEGGESLSSSFDPTLPAPGAVAQTKDDIEAGALDFRLDYLLADPHKSRLSLETIFATGDADRFFSTSNTLGGNHAGTNDRAFNAFGLLNTGLAFGTSVSNLGSVRVGGSTYPFASGVLKKFQIGADVLAFAKFDEDAPIDEPTSDDRFLGWEPDLFINWQITSDLAFALRYGVFFPGDAILSDDSPRNFLFAGMTFAF